MYVKTIHFPCRGHLLVVAKSRRATTRNIKKGAKNLKNMLFFHSRAIFWEGFMFWSLDTSYLMTFSFFLLIYRSTKQKEIRPRRGKWKRRHKKFHRLQSIELCHLLTFLFSGTYHLRDIAMKQCYHFGEKNIMTVSQIVHEKKWPRRGSKKWLQILSYFRGHIGATLVPVFGINFCPQVPSNTFHEFSSKNPLNSYRYWAT